MSDQQPGRQLAIKHYVDGEAFKAEVSAALPEHVKFDRFRRVLLTSVANDHRLQNVDPLKVVREALKIAALGLITDPHLGEAYLIADSRGEVQCRIGYRGLIKLARQSGEVAAIYAHEVFANDQIECVLGDEKHLKHIPKLFGDRGPIVGYYAVIRYSNGETDFEPMDKADIDKIRDRSDGWKAFKAGKIKDTPWNSSYDEMAKKTVIRRLLKRSPQSADLQEAMIHEGRLDELEYSGNEPARAQQPPPRGRNLDDFAERHGSKTIDGQADAPDEQQADEPEEGKADATAPESPQDEPEPETAYDAETGEIASPGPAGEAQQVDLLPEDDGLGDAGDQVVQTSKMDGSKGGMKKLSNAVAWLENAVGDKRLGDGGYRDLVEANLDWLQLLPPARANALRNARGVGGE